MDENKPDLLSEIFDRAEHPAPPPQRPRFEYPPQDDPVPSSPADSMLSPSPPSGGTSDKKEPSISAKLLPWLCMVLGTALLVLGICLLQLVRMNHRLDELQQTIENMQAVDGLREENQQLQQDLEELQELLDQAGMRNDWLMQVLDDDTTWQMMLSFQKRRAECLFYIGQFIDNGDDPMAALAVTLSAEMYFSDVSINGQTVPVNQAQLAQYQAYRKELADKGYIELKYGAIIDSSPTVPDFADQWDPSKNHDMAALGILWCAINNHFIQGNDNAATQFLCYSPLANPVFGYQNRVNRLASDFTLEQFQLMKDELVELDALRVGSDGAMTEGGWTHTEEAYSLPFELPPFSTFSSTEIH